MKNTAAMKYRAWPAEQAGIICWALLLIAMIITSIVPNNGLFPSETKYWDKIFHFTTNSIATMLPLVAVGLFAFAAFAVAVGKQPWIPME